MTDITPLQALRRLVDIARLIDADECPEFYNQLQGELVIAGAVLAIQADDFAHFLSYSGLSSESEEVKEKLQRAFEAGQPSSTVERFWNAVERQQYAQPAALNAKLVAALRDMVVWFGQYPDLVPDESHYDKYRAAIDNARFVLVAYGMK